MKSLTDYNNDMNKLLLEVPVKTGVTCPNCNTEMEFTNPNQLLLTNPPKREVHCTKCNHKGFML